MFAAIPQAPADAILGLTEQFNKDPNPLKINLGVGVYKDSAGKTPVLESVKAAEKLLLEKSATRNYLPIDGSPAYRQVVQELIFGKQGEIVTAGRAYTAQAPGGTGALRIAADFIKQHLPSATVWMTNPTWPNHPQIFEAAGVKVASFAWFDPKKNGLDFDAAMADLAKIPAGDVVVLHGCCHNPTGADPDAAQWARIADVLAERGILPLVDFAYQGFGAGLEEDAAGVRAVAAKCPELVICSSFSKNFGLYSERVGAITVVSADAEITERVGSQVKRTIRANYSNPPEHGGAIVATIVNDPALHELWLGELRQMRQRIHHMRTKFVDTLKEKGVQRDFSFISEQRGMFSFSGLTKEQVQALKDRYSIYIVGSGRISVAGMTESNMDRLCTAIAEVIR